MSSFIRGVQLARCASVRLGTPKSFLGNKVYGVTSHLGVRSASTFNYTSQEPTIKPREVPRSASYFTGNPDYNDLLMNLDELQKEYSDFSEITINTTVSPWLTNKRLSEVLGLSLTSAQYRKITSRLNVLNRKQNLPEHITAYLQRFKRAVDVGEEVQKVKAVDEFGKSYGFGKRKSSSARVWMVEGEGQFFVNGKPLADYFYHQHDREKTIFPFIASNTLGKYNTWALAQGGGTTGQAESVALGVTRALIVQDLSKKPVLREAGCITHDPRRVERKKTGQPKARKKDTWVKR
ncbi:37S ribosomal protein S9, mitochondrial [Basidiobolus ranarum]|uniref:Small ribosomal subunit protein uS9m n=1 Tax=Basidiobolus ranarum TaxID=34480 RepID=A0ABR2WY75_9FUNG